MKRIVPAVLATALLAALTACMIPRAAAVRPSQRMRVPVIPAALTTGARNDPAASFAVSEVGPTGIVPHENLEGGIWVLFNKPVIALKSLDKPAASSSVLSITPRIEGIYRWYGSRLLSFEPKGQHQNSSNYAKKV